MWNTTALSVSSFLRLTVGDQFLGVQYRKLKQYYVVAKVKNDSVTVFVLFPFTSSLDKFQLSVYAQFQVSVFVSELAAVSL